MSASKAKANDSGGGGAQGEKKESGQTKKRAGLYDQNVPTFYVGAGNNPEL